MEIRKLDRDSMPEEYGVSVQRLVPWPALNAPFEGAWVVIAPGQATDAHSHHEYEIFIAISGEGALEAEGERRSFMPGDIVHFPPGVHHQVINAGKGEFQFYSVFWDADMSEKFAARHAAQRQDHPAAS
ncbi:MAG: cupin domain-containing protein [Actinomycetota bacterium]|nr:cupin domain-containing protein [Actinomycetota bacterium]